MLRKTVGFLTTPSALALTCLALSCMALSACTVTPEAQEQAIMCTVTPPEEPVACTMQYDPVCGCDGKTYGNACVARGSGVPEFTAGACGDPNAS